MSLSVNGASKNPEASLGVGGGFIEEVVCFFVFSKAVISFWLKSKWSMVNKVLINQGILSDKNQNKPVKR